MSDYVSNVELSQIAKLLSDASRVVITTHAKPDGDAFGSVVALARALDAKGVRNEQWFMPPVPDSFEPYKVDESMQVFDAQSNPQPADEPDWIIVLDTGAWSQLDPMRSWLEPRQERIIVVDHHLRGDDLAKHRFVDTSAAAVCEIVADLIDALGVDFDAKIAEALYMGIATDTGWFKFSNTRSKTHALTARLMEFEFDSAGMYLHLEQQARTNKLQLLQRALGGLQVVNNGEAAVMTLTPDDFSATGATMDETERFVDIPQMVRDIQVVVLITKFEPDAITRISFRSKPGEAAVDVSELARTIGGGGHARAAGAKMPGSVEEAQSKVVELLSS